MHASSRDSLPTVVSGIVDLRTSQVRKISFLSTRHQDRPVWQQTAAMILASLFQIAGPIPETGRFIVNFRGSQDGSPEISPASYEHPSIGQESLAMIASRRVQTSGVGPSP